jgi:hypothetical protein
MKNGAAFPPIVLAATLHKGRDVMIDGNTRARAAQTLKLNTFPAYRVSPIADPNFARMLGAALNNLGGDRLSRAEPTGPRRCSLSSAGPMPACPRARRQRRGCAPLAARNRVRGAHGTPRLAGGG